MESPHREKRAEGNNDDDGRDDDRDDGHDVRDDVHNDGDEDSDDVKRGLFARLVNHCEYYHYYRN